MYKITTIRELRDIIQLIKYGYDYHIADKDGFIIEKYGVWYKYKNLAICCQKLDDKNRFEDSLSICVIPDDYHIEHYSLNSVLQGNFLYVFGEEYNECGKYCWKCYGKWNKCFEDMILWLKIEQQKIYLQKSQNKNYDFFNSLF